MVRLSICYSRDWKANGRALPDTPVRFYVARFRIDGSTNGGTVRLKDGQQFSNRRP
jgi:hypothetical protein